jgi:prepilin-type N-terminal cleavage/methylation domain-containing protein
MPKQSFSGVESAFTLVELSIVLVIIGLLIGGILGGQELIRSSELNSVAADYTKYKTSVNTFRTKYNALPGDFSTATSYWPTGSTANGDNDGIIELYDESYRAWQHLNLSGIVPGNYTGTHTGNTSVLGVNSPESKVNGAGWGFYNGPAPWSLTIPVRNNLMFGAPSAGDVTTSPALTPTDTWNIDRKLDDSRSSTGLMITGSTGCVSGITSADNYVLTTSTKVCAFNIAL